MTTEIKKAESKELRISQFNEFETKLVEFKEKYAGVVYDLSDKKQRKQAGADRLSIGKVVVKLDKAHKDVKAPLLAKTKLLDGERKRIKDELQSVQNEIGSQIKKHEDATKAAEKRAADAEAKTLLDASEKERLALEETERVKLQARQAEAETARLAQKVTDDAAQSVIDQESAAKREADTGHRKEVNNNAVDDIEALGISRIAGKSFVQAVAKGLIRGVSISY